MVHFWVGVSSSCVWCPEGAFSYGVDCTVRSYLIPILDWASSSKSLHSTDGFCLQSSSVALPFPPNNYTHTQNDVQISCSFPFKNKTWSVWPVWRICCFFRFMSLWPGSLPSYLSHSLSFSIRDCFKTSHVISFFDSPSSTFFSLW